MKKAAAAGALMLVMIGASAWNIRFIDGFADSLIEQIELSRAQWASGNTQSAEETLEHALDRWFGAETYTHVFIRHAEVNDVTDAFFDVFAALNSGDGAAGSQYDRLEAHLRSIDDMEHVTIRSVF